jgi:hypothetical protein
MQPPTSPLLHQKCHNQVAPVVLSSHLREENEKRKRKRKKEFHIKQMKQMGAKKIKYSFLHRTNRRHHTTLIGLLSVYSILISSFLTLFFFSFTICATRLHYPPSLPHQRMHFSYTDTIHTNINFLKK